ncbi:hypothetical protein EV424DRAFT_1352106 [Suillus variegatus]|nr:hypothetical protein EV424DRAFT_1352106 [Suillus variegatus]
MGLIFDVLVLMLRLLIVKLLGCWCNVMLRSWVFSNIVTADGCGLAKSLGSLGLSEASKAKKRLKIWLCDRQEFVKYDAKGHQCTAEEMVVAKAAEAKKATATQVGIQRLARIEITMEEKQVNAVAKKAKPVQPPPKGRPKAGLGDGPGKRRKKKGIQESINHARDEMINRTSHLDGGSDSKGPRANKGSENTLVNPNFTLGGKVQNWISGVDKTSKPHEPATQTSNAVPPFTIFMHLTENTEITIESATSTGTGGKSGTVLVGGFDDEEPEDDSLERQVATYYSDLSPYNTRERTCIISRMIWASGPWAHDKNILDYDGWAGRQIIPDGGGWAHAGNI